MVVAALYKFAPLDRLEQLQARLIAVGEDAAVKGSLLIAPEGVNGTLAGTRAGIDRFIDEIRCLPGFADIEHKESFAERPPFGRLRVRIKREIVTIREPLADPNKAVGTYVDPADWNELISDPDVIVIDTRNDYEVEIGTFERAIDPKTASFGQFPDWVRDNLDAGKHHRVAMFCTGGIRCEKASALLKNMGFGEVYHLKGGILKYLEEVPAAQSKWQGECFVFDGRVSLKHGLQPGTHAMCETCNHAYPKADLNCPHCGSARRFGETTEARQIPDG
ncbi:MAG: rhodanese-related sulfurtransferase [Alphaproteobacteria bacterium]|nr:rhodanese-related sulfurtransferase [Alphaproteobacteria bacterium]